MYLNKACQILPDMLIVFLCFLLNVFLRVICLRIIAMEMLFLPTHSKEGNIPSDLMKGDASLQSPRKYTQRRIVHQGNENCEEGSSDSASVRLKKRIRQEERETETKMERERFPSLDLDLSPHRCYKFMSSSSPSSSLLEKHQSVQQLTIFYNGEVHVYEATPHEAEAVISLANQLNQNDVPPATSVPLLPPPTPFVTTPISTTPLLSPLRPSTSAISRPVSLPMATRSSLLRFLARRNHRLQQPRQHN